MKNLNLIFVFQQPSTEKNEEAEPAFFGSIDLVNQEGEEPHPPNADAKSGTPELVIEVKRFLMSCEPGRFTKRRGDVNLNVSKGTIYGLIGENDTSSLLEFIAGVGTHLPRQVRVLGQVPGTPGASVPGPGVGYVSHRFPLYREHSVGEIFRFVGSLYGVTKPHAKQRIETLSDLIKLPPGKSLVKELSDVQSHLVSIAAALLHSPPLLVIEQTPHLMSPLTGWRIWNLLRMLKRDEGVTILITSSNIEELQQADLVGIMESGRIIEQDSPSRLLARFKCKTLRDVSIKLYKEKELERSGTNKKRLISEGVAEGSLDDNANAWAQDEKGKSLSGSPQISEPATAPATAIGGDTRVMKPLGEALNPSRRIFMLSKLFLTSRGVEWFLVTAFNFQYGVIVGFMLALWNPKTTSTDVLKVEGNLSTAEYMTPGAIFSCIFSMSVLLTMLNGRHRNYWADRSLMAGMKAHEIAAASMIAQFCVLLIPMVLVFCFMVDGLPSLRSVNPVSLSLLIILCLLQTFQGMVVGMFASIRWLPPLSSVLWSFMYCMCNSFLTLSLQPRETAPLRGFVAPVFPQTYPAKAFRGIVHRAWGVETYDVWIGLLASICWSSLLAYVVGRIVALSIRLRVTI